MAKTDATTSKAIINYYQRTQLEYRYIWRLNKGLALHFGYYDDVARTHDAAVVRLNEKLADLINVTARDNVLDAGCGVGGSSIWLAANRGCHVTGITLAPHQVDQARSHAAQRNVTDLTTFAAADFQATQLPADTFSVAWAIESSVHATDKLSFAKEMARVMRPGGRLMIAEYHLKPEPLTPEQDRIIKAWCDGWAMPQLIRSQDYYAALEAAGFTDIQIVDWTESVRPSLDRLKRFVVVGKFITPLLRRLRIVNHAEVGNLAASAAQMAALKQGLWRYKIVTAVKK